MAGYGCLAPILLFFTLNLLAGLSLPDSEFTSGYYDDADYDDVVIQIGLTVVLPTGSAPASSVTFLALSGRVVILQELTASAVYSTGALPRAPPSASPL